MEGQCECRCESEVRIRSKGLIDVERRGAAVATEGGEVAWHEPMLMHQSRCPRDGDGVVLLNSEVHKLAKLLKYPRAKAAHARLELG